MTETQTINIQSLVDELKNNIKGEVRFDNGSRALYATDASNYRQTPIGVVIPKEIDDVIKTVNLCHKNKVPLLSRGGGTSLAGQCCNTAVIMDFSKYLNKILELNHKEKYAWVEPGLVLDNLRNAAEKHNLTFGPDPATHNHCTLGGMIGNNSCGIHSVMAGKTVENILELDVLTYDGIRLTVGPTSNEQYNKIIKEGGRKSEIYKSLKRISENYKKLIHEKFPDIPRRVSGYNLPDLLEENGFNIAKALVGTESTCVVVLRAKVKLVSSPPERSLVVLGYPDVFQAGDHVPEILKFKPIGLEGIDDILIGYMKSKGMNINDLKLLPKGKGWLLVEFGGQTKEEADANAKKLVDRFEDDKNGPSTKLYDDKDEEDQIWEIRESGLGATAHIPGEKSTWPGWEDSAVPPEKVGSYLRDLKDLFHKYNYNASVYGHFGQGCIHCRIPFDLRTAEGLDNFKKFVNEAADLVINYNGSLSGEHGDGQARGPLLYKMYGEELIQAFREFKSAWDPDWKMNPGKVVDAYNITENLRMGTDYSPWVPKTVFQYPEDDGDFPNVTLRCVGVGKCRREEGGTMCPSYMVTHEEMHSTRGRARLLFEMLQGDAIKEKWKSEHVKEALDLCLACKGCKNDCPVNVDMATYKAEFLSHYYKGKIREMPAYTMGLIYWWARLASKFPSFVNFLMSAPGISIIMKKIAGLAPERKIPKFAKQTFRNWFNKRSKGKKQNGKKVILWPDTFNNFLLPETGVAAALFLENAGYNVVLPSKVLCCGRPLYDYGFLDLAKKLLRETLDVLKDDIEAGTPIVGIEPSCIATFRDELNGLFNKDEDAQRLKKQFYTLAEFIEKENIPLPTINRKAIVHGHCHHKSIMHFDSDEKVLKKTGLDFTLPESGCCGMAGSFGFEASKYDVSVKCGERVLIPKVNEADKNTLIVADGFSCREQIKQLTNRQALHLAELIYVGQHNGKFKTEDEALSELKKISQQ